EHRVRGDYVRPAVPRRLLGDHHGCRHAAVQENAVTRPGRDTRTRQRVLDAAAQLFAERGFRKVTVREICRRARANVAAVNYHFRDKAGLYREVVEMAIAVMEQTNAVARQAAEAAPPADRLRAHVRVYVGALANASGPSWMHQIIMREQADPTFALDLFV